MYYIYILTNNYHTTLYIGVTNNIERRHLEHTLKVNKGFSYKYNTSKIVYYECCNNIDDAIAREKQLKKWSRIKKEALINSFNPKWNDLSKT